MSVKRKFLLVLGLFVSTFSFAQVEINRLFKQSPEVIIKFQIRDKSQLKSLARIVSIDKVTENEVVAYTCKEEFERFLTLNIPYEIVEKPVLTPEELNMMDFRAIRNSKNDWNFYPSYEAYLSLMEEFAANYPDICRVVEFGTTVQNRKLLACVLSKNVNVREREPQVFWSSSIHGDELTGYVLMLRFIDYLLSNYGVNERITHLLDNMEIWINPLSNPDGTYWTGNSSVSGARRNNANSRDLNRNYKDWILGDHPDGHEWQQETLAFMDLQAGQNFVLGANIHGGDEVCNYPWDNTYKRHADDAWWQFVCREYADTVHSHAPQSYMRLFDNGITNGAGYYVISGSRQDYANFSDHNREFCLEISSVKTPPATQLPDFWNYNYRSFLNFTEQALYGIHGKVSEAGKGEPVDAKVFVKDHDVDSSFVMTDPRVGYYVRPIKAGTYSVTFSAEGYVSQTVEITISDRQTVVQNIELVLEKPPAPEDLPVKIFPNPVAQGETLTIDANYPIRKMEWINMSGAIVKTIYADAISSTFFVSGIDPGIYLLKIETSESVKVMKIQVR